MLKSTVETNKIIVYEYNFIYELSNQIKTLLDEDTLVKLLEIKKNNKFIRRRSPLRLKYKLSVADTWRKNRENISTMSLLERCINSLLSNLNKISNTNYPQIVNIIKDDYKILLDNENSSETETFIVSICNKAMTENIYSGLYAKVLLELNEKDPSVKDIVIRECDSFFEKSNNITINDINAEDNYDELCNIIKQKSNMMGGFVFIANLFKYELVSYKMILNYYNTLIIYTNNSPKDCIGKYLDAIVNIITGCGKSLENANPSKFKENFMEICYTIIKDKDKIGPKYRFKLMDLCDLYERKWEQDSEWDNT